MAEQENDGYKNFLEQIDDALGYYPTLFKKQVNGRIILAGRLPVIDKDGQQWDDYEVEIHATELFPARFPDLYEIGGKIPRIGDWHVNEDTFTCCITVPPREILCCKEGITLSSYISKEVMPYLFNQTHRRVEGYYVNGEYSHGVRGLLEYYSSILKTDQDAAAVVKLLLYTIKNDPPLRTGNCFCGSGLKYRHCHRTAYQDLKQLPQEELLKDIWLIGKRFGLLDKNNK